MPSGFWGSSLFQGCGFFRVACIQAGVVLLWEPSVWEISGNRRDKPRAPTRKSAKALVNHGVPHSRTFRKKELLAWELPYTNVEKSGFVRMVRQRHPQISVVTEALQSETRL